MGAAPTSVNLGPRHISETVRARKLKFYTHLNTATYSRKLKFYAPLDGAKCSLRYENFALGVVRG